MQVTARLNNLKIAPRKVRLVAHVIKGMSADAALIELSKQVKRSSEPMSKLLRSAIANAEHNFGIDPSNLFVRSVLVGDGKRLKRWQPRAFGRANQILHRLSNVSLVVEERIEGLNRKEVRKDEAKKVAPSKKTKEAEGKAVLAADERKETKKDSSVKQEMKERKNAVKRVYQRKSI